MSICKECDQPMTDEEVVYLEDRCNACEELAHARLAAWREGAHDPDMDAGRFFIMPEVH